MNRIFRFVAMLLLAVWLPATGHCMLEAAGVLDLASQEAAGSGCCVDSNPCADDNCEFIEQGLRAPSDSSLKVPVAQVLATVDFLCVAVDAEREGPDVSSRLGDALEKPLDWVPVWHFEHRTALPSRAPSPVCA